MRGRPEPELTPEEEYEIALRKIRFGHIVLYSMVGFVIITASLHAFFFKVPKPYWILYVVLGFTYLALAVSYYKNPYEISIAALCIYIFLFLCLASNKRSILLFWMAPLHAFIAIGLSTAINHAKKYNKAKERKIRKKNSDVLDDDFISPDSSL